MSHTSVRKSAVVTAVVFAAMWIVISSPALGGREGEFSQRYDLVINEDVIIGERVGRVILQNFSVEEKETSKGSRLSFEVNATNPKGHDQAVLVILKLEDADGNVIQSIDRQKIVEEGGKKTLKLRADLNGTERPARLLLNVEAWDE